MLIYSLYVMNAFKTFINKENKKMPFRPDTTYYINGTEYATFYEAINAARLPLR